MKSYARYAELRRVLKPVLRKLTGPVHSRVYRCVGLKWARPEKLLEGKGAFIHGSRWMHAGVCPAAYAASTESIALKEARRVYTHFGVPPRKTPRLSVEIQITLRRVVDINRISGHTPWPDLEELVGEDWSCLQARGIETMGQAVGRLVWESGAEGLWVPSVCDRRARNLIWFPGALDSESRVEITGEEELVEWIAK